MVKVRISAWNATFLKRRVLKMYFYDFGVRLGLFEPTFKKNLFSVYDGEAEIRGAPEVLHPYE